MTDNNQPTIGDRVYIALPFAGKGSTFQVRIVKGTVESVLFEIERNKYAPPLGCISIIDPAELLDDGDIQVRYKILFDNINNTDGDANIISANHVFDDYNAAVKFAKKFLKGIRL